VRNYEIDAKQKKQRQKKHRQFTKRDRCTTKQNKKERQYMAQLPQEFLTRMQDMLGDEFDAFLTSYDAPRTAGLRVNTKKCRTEDFPPLVPGTWKKIPWIPNGYFVPDGMRMGQSPLYAAGVFYLQEPSAMTPASRLPIEPGERVLDLCAAPGGKATELNARLKGTGLLVANDISNARAKALLRNLELFGSENVLVTNETPAGLADVFPGFFDKILVDAPCSGEGMFRKDEAVIGTWTPERPVFFADLQREITSNAVKMLRPGGLMMYSTCTFAPQEDEGTVSFLLENFPEMELIEMEGYEGFSKGNPVWGNGDPEIEKTVRIWPHKMNGEGHYLALFRKKGEAIPYETEEKPIEKKNKKQKNRKKDRGTEAPGPSKAEKQDPFRFPVPDDSTDPGGGTGSPRRKSIPFPVPAGWRAESSFPAERSVSR